jgi:hypothetical protein
MVRFLKHLLEDIDLHFLFIVVPCGLIVAVLLTERLFLAADRPLLSIGIALIWAGAGAAIMSAILLLMASLGMWPFHRVLLNGKPLPTSFVSKNELKATISPEDIATAGTYIVTVKSEGETLPESHRAHLVVGFKP